MKSSTDASSKTARQKDVSDSAACNQVLASVCNGCAYEDKAAGQNACLRCFVNPLHRRRNLLSLCVSADKCLVRGEVPPFLQPTQRPAWPVGFLSGPSGSAAPWGAASKATACVSHATRVEPIAQSATREVSPSRRDWKNTKWKRSGRQRYLRAGGGCGWTKIDAAEIPNSDNRCVLEVKGYSRVTSGRRRDLRRSARPAGRSSVPWADGNCREWGAGAGGGGGENLEGFL